jgi:hypothetical protein
MLRHRRGQPNVNRTVTWDRRLASSGSDPLLHSDPGADGGSQSWAGRMSLQSFRPKPGNRQGHRRLIAPLVEHGAVEDGHLLEKALAPALEKSLTQAVLFR